MPQLTITNTLTGQKEKFVPLIDSQVKMYVCGITPYDYAHIGHGRVYVTFDIMYRLLTFLGYQVSYCRNFTDIDDKLLNKAAKEFGDQMRYHEIARRYIDAYHQDMQSLQCLPPTYEPYVTETINEIIVIVQNLIDQGHAYTVNGSVYYSVSSFENYGKLSKQNLDELSAGARVEIDLEKHSPLDFALWKSEENGTFWQSPWGWGRPGWHIECSAMANKFLGAQIDLHAGGQDLTFPHHENEIAQSEGAHNSQFAKYWMHNAFVQINKEKMSKSLGNFFTLKDIFKSYDPMILRYYLACHNYNTPLEFDINELGKLQKSYQRLALALNEVSTTQVTIEQVKSNPVTHKMLQFICDDLNISGLFGVIFENLTQMDLESKQCVKFFLQQIIGLTMLSIEHQLEITPQIQDLIDQRESARAVKNWALADQIREELSSLGLIVQDKK